MKIQKVALKVVVLIMLLLLMGCEEDTNISSIQINEETMHSHYYIEDFELGTIQLEIFYKDGDKALRDITHEMVSNDDLEKLSDPGFHSIQIDYHGFTTLLAIKLIETDLDLKLINHYEQGVSDGLIAGSYDDWLESIQGEDGKEVELRATDSYIQWRYKGSDFWIDLIQLSSLEGQDGTDGEEGLGLSYIFINDKNELVITYMDDSTTNLGVIVGEDGKDGSDGIDAVNIVDIGLNDKGELIISFSNDTQTNVGSVVGPEGQNGREVELRTNEDYIQWRYESDEIWIDLIELSSLEGLDGIDGIDGEDGLGLANLSINDKDELIVTYTDNSSVNLGIIVGTDGEDGIGIIGMNINDDGYLIIELSDNSEVNAGLVVGKAGKDGNEVEINVSDTHIQWRYREETTWIDLVELDSLTGEKGDQGISVSDTMINSLGELVITYSDGTSENLGEILKVHTVQFKDSLGHVLDTQLLTTGSDGKAPESPYKEGYTFEGWNQDFDNVTEDLVITPVFSINTYSVVFMSQGEVVAEKAIAYGNTFEVADVPLKEGHTFKGWIPDDPSFKLDESVKNDMVFHAEFIPIIEEVYHLSAHVETDTLFTLPKEILVRTELGDDQYVEADWFESAVYPVEEGKRVILGEMEGYQGYIEFHLHASVIKEDENLLSGYVSGLEDSTDATVIMSDQNISYATKTLEEGYYEFNDVPDGDYSLKVELNGYKNPDPIEVSFSHDNEIENMSALSTSSDHIKHVNFEVERFNEGHYHYQWKYGGDYFGYEESAYVNHPIEFEFLDEEVVMNDSSAAIKLLNQYDIVLSDSSERWSNEYASRLLDVMRRIPSKANETLDKKSVWELTDDFLDSDIEIVYGDTVNTVRISTAAFQYATPRMAEIDGVKGQVFSNRLHHAAVRYRTQNGVDLDSVEKIFNERYDVSIQVPDYKALTDFTTSESSHRFQQFKPEELLILLTMFEEMPEGMQKTPGLDYLVRRQDGMDHPIYSDAPAVAWSDAYYMEFMDSAFTTTSENYLSRLIVHEISHFLWGHLFTDEIKERWIELGGWYETEETSSGWATTKTTEFVSSYAHLKNPNEDMAESISYYLVQPEKLKSRSPNKYDFIRDFIMHGHTYQTEIRDDLTFEVYNLYPDYDYPGKINRINIDVLGLPEEDKDIEIEIEINSDDAYEDSASSAILRIYSDEGTYFDVWLHPVNEEGTILRGNHSLSKYAKSGYWHTDQITVNDAVGNQRFEGVSDFGWKLYIDNPLEDLTPPELVEDSIDVSVDEILIEGNTVYEVEVSYEVIEEHIKRHNGGYVSIEDKNLSTYRYESYGSCDEITNQCVVRFEFTDFHPNEIYQIRQITTTDKANNKQTRYFSFNENDVDPVTFYLDTKDEDLNAPTLDLNNISINAEPVNPEAPDGETYVTIEYYAKDDKAGLGRVAYNLLDPQGISHHQYHYHENYYTLFFEGDATAWTKYTINVILPKGSAPGTWGLQEMYLQDKAGNFVVHNFEEIVHFVIEE